MLRSEGANEAKIPAKARIIEMRVPAVSAMPHRSIGHISRLNRGCRSGIRDFPGNPARCTNSPRIDFRHSTSLTPVLDASHPLLRALAALCARDCHERQSER